MAAAQIPRSTELIFLNDAPPALADGNRIVSAPRDAPGFGRLNHSMPNSRYKPTLQALVTPEVWHLFEELDEAVEPPAQPVPKESTPGGRKKRKQKTVTQMLVAKETYVDKQGVTQYPLLLRMAQNTQWYWMGDTSVEDEAIEGLELEEVKRNLFKAPEGSVYWTAKLQHDAFGSEYVGMRLIARAIYIRRGALETSGGTVCDVDIDF